MPLASRVRPALAGFGLSVLIVALMLLLPWAGPATAQDEPTPTPTPGVGEAAPDDAGTGGERPGCAVTGYLVPPGEDLARVREDLRGEDTRLIQGVDLTRGSSPWVLPDGHQPVLVVDSTEPLDRASVTMAVAGREFRLSSGDPGEGARRYVSGVLLPHLGATTRTIGLEVAAGPCAAAPVVTVDRSVWSTRVGQAGVGLTALSGALLVLLARRRKGGWPRRFLVALPFGLLAGVGQVAVLHEAGRVDPFGTPPWWPPVVGLALAALLPLTRPRRRAAWVPADDPATDLLPPVDAVVAGYRLTAPFGRTQVAGLFRAIRVPTVPGQPGPATAPDQPAPDQPASSGPAPDESGEPVVVKVALPERAGEPLTRLRLEREAAALAGLEHPNVIRLREVVPGDGPPALVFDDIDAVSLRQMLGSGAGLTGPQVVTVVVELLSGLSELHRRGLVHRDIRPETVYLDRAGRVRLTNFELACVGMEHPAAVEGAAPYASPEQLAGQVLDERSDLWSCGVVLAELLTGRVPDPHQPPDLPASLAEVLAAALATDPAARPESAERLAARLRDAAEREWGPDWVARGALAGAVVAHGAIGSMAAGYAAAGTATFAGAGAAGAAGSAGMGAAALGATGLGAAGPAGVTMAAGGATAAGQAVAVTGGKVSAAISAAAATAVVAGVGLSVVLVDPEPVQARTEVITPERARIIMVDTVTEATERDADHLTEEAWDLFEGLLSNDELLEGASLTDVVVGVPRDQYEYPAWFVGSARFTGGDATIYLFTRFERAAAAEPWLMTSFNYAVDEELPPPALDDDGWLATLPEVTDLAVDPETLPERYLDWLLRVADSAEVGEDDLLALRYEFGTLHGFAEDQLFDGDLDDVSFDYEMSAGEVVTDLVPLADGTVHVVFTAVVHQVMYNTPNRRPGSCDVTYLFWSNRQPSGIFRRIEHDFVITVEAWVPIEDEEVASDEVEVIIEDWKRRSENREGTPC